jgi:hypothetical protein
MASSWCTWINDMQTIGKTLLLFVFLPALLGLGGCGDKQQAAADGGNGSDSTASLPKPEITGGSVTGMPDRPGPGQIGAPDTASPDTPVASDDSLVEPAVDDDMLDDGTLPDATEPPSPGTGAIPQDALPAGEPTAQDALAVVREYYGAIDSHNYARAYSLWSDGGRSSGKTLQQFADGFADTASVAVALEAPSRIDAAAGSRYIEVPVTLTATRRDGSVRRYAGTYTLRRAVVDGATAEQRAWRIASSDIDESD